MVVNGTSITADVFTSKGGPRGSRVWDVVVTNPDFSRGVLSNGFTVAVPGDAVVRAVVAVFPALADAVVVADEGRARAGEADLAELAHGRRLGKQRQAG